MGRQWNQIIESLGPLTGGTVSINANLGDIDALLTTIQADIADGIPLNPNLDYIKLNGSLNGPNDNFTLGWYAPRDTTQDRKWTIVNKFTVYLEDGIWKLYCLDEDNTGLVASADVSDQGDIRQYLPPKTGWTFEAGWSGTFSVSLIQPSVENISTTGGTGPTTFTSTTYGTIATANADRKGLTIFNQGTGNLHVTLGTSTASTSSYTVRLASGDYYEVPFSYTGLVGGIFATSGTARITEVS